MLVESIARRFAPVVHRITPVMAHDWWVCGGFFAARHQSNTKAQDTFASKLGAAVHELCVAYDRHLVHSVPNIHSIVVGNWRPGRFARGEEEQQAMADAAEFLGTYAALRAEETVQVIANELFARTSRRSLGNGQFIVLSGRMDRVAWKAGSTLEVLDLKTAAVLPSQDELRRDPASTIYHLLAKERFGAECLSIAQVSLRSGARVEICLLDNDIDNGKQQIRTMADQLATGSFSLSPGVACAYCPRSAECPAILDNEAQLDVQW